MTKEQKFYNALKDIFIGAKVEGESGYINLMRIKSRYYEKGVFPKLHEDVDKALKPFPHFRDELFDKLYTYFHRYFSESGSIYFRYTPLHQNVYEKVYTDDKDVMLFYKTHMLYYVKTDRMFKSLEVELDGQKFFFDVSTLEHKKSNEKREIIYSLKDKRKDGTLIFTVAYSEKGRKTKVDDILKAVKKNGVKLKEELLERAFRVFEKQSEVDYFINKNAKAFLEEQFNLWLYQYVFSGESGWTETRIKQLQTLRDVAFKIIAFISQFEDELVKIWNKPKFVLNSNYVITLDRIASPLEKGGQRGILLIEKFLNHKNFKSQVEEWKELGIINGSFKKTEIIENNLTGKYLNKKYKYLPVDTKYFKELELEILSLFDNLDEALDGRLIKSENYQALNTILPKFREEVQTVYIDPPYNTDASEIMYINNYKHSSWMTLIENRLFLTKQLLKNSGILCITIDHVELHRLSAVVEEVFGKSDILGLVCIRNNPSGRSTVKGFSIANEYAIFVGSTDKAAIGTVPRTDAQLAQYDETDELGKFQWRNFMRSGGENDFREARPRLYYPLFVTDNLARMPKIEWDEGEHSWTLKEQPKRGEEVIYPTSSNNEYTWRLGIETLKQRTDDLRVRVSRDGKRIIEIKFRLQDENEGVLPKTIWDNKLFNATAYGTSMLRQILGGSQLFSFPKSIYAVEECIRVCNTGYNDIVVDFFGGSGTTAHAVINLNREDGGKRKYILVEMGDYFNTVLMPRIKKVVFSDKWKDGKAQEGKGIGHFVKYYQLEQYEDTLRRVKYDDSDLFDDPNQDPYSQYVFLRDLKMLDALKVDLKKNKVTVDLSKLYDGIDIAETLSNLKGKWIKRITSDPLTPLRASSVEFADGETVDLKNLDYKLIKPLIWW